MKKPEALEKLDAAMRLQNKSRDTRKTYRGWVERYLLFVEETKPQGKAADKLNSFISRLVSSDPQPALSTQKQAFFSVLYFYKHVLDANMDGANPPSGRRDQKTFNILSRDQIVKLIQTLPKEYKLIASLLYGTGMRIGECLALRIKDVDFEHGFLYVQEGKGDKARRVDLPPTLVSNLKAQVEYARHVYEFDQRTGMAGVYIPHLYAKKKPEAATSFEWFRLFPNPNYGKDPDSGVKRRHHVYTWDVQDAFQEARKAAKLPIYTTPHTLRHCYATHYLEKVLRDLPPVPNIGRFARDLLREKMGHVDANTTDVYIHLAMPKNVITNHSPLSELE